MEEDNLNQTDIPQENNVEKQTKIPQENDVEDDNQNNSRIESQ